MRLQNTTNVNNGGQGFRAEPSSNVRSESAPHHILCSQPHMCGVQCQSGPGTSLQARPSSLPARQAEPVTSHGPTWPSGVPTLQRLLGHQTGVIARAR